MKRVILLFFLGSLSFSLLANSPVNFGLNFRLNMPRSVYNSTDWDQFFDDIAQESSTDGYTNVVDNSNMGYAGGVFLRFNGNSDGERSGKGFLHTEAMFAFNSTGVLTEDARTGEDLTINTESTVFNVPVYFGRNFVNKPAFKFRIMTGPSLEWNINTTTTAHHDGVDISNVHSSVAQNDFNWYWGVGAGIELLMFSFDARYCVDMEKATGASGAGSSYSQRINMVEFTLGFKLF